MKIFYLFYRYHTTVKFYSMKVFYTSHCVIAVGQCNITVATSAWSSSVSYNFCSNNPSVFGKYLFEIGGTSKRRQIAHPKVPGLRTRTLVSFISFKKFTKLYNYSIKLDTQFFGLFSLEFQSQINKSSKKSFL